MLRLSSYNLPTRLLLVLSIVLIAGASLLGVITAGDNVTELDLRVSSELQAWQGDFPAALHRTGDMLGDTAAAVSGLVFLVGMAALLRERRAIAFLAIVAMLRLLGMGLKPIFDSPRPIEVEARVRIYEHFEGLGFPSGHSMTAAMFATIAIMLVWHVHANRFTRITVTVIAVAFMLFVGWSRIWSGAHWPTDVLGGWAYGIALVLIAWVITVGVGSDSERQTPESPELR